MEKQNILRIVSNETLAAVQRFEIVTPTLFASIYAQKASKYNLELTDDLQNSHEIMQQEYLALNTLQAKTSQNTQKLSQSTSRAIVAIKDKDESLLQNVLQETESLKQELEKLRASIYQDALTKTYNRKWLQDNYCNYENMRSQGTLALIDLNYFKSINDTYGHIIGDKILLFFANKLLALRNPVVRYGGDEFLLFFPASVTLNEIKNRLTQMRQEILKKSFQANGAKFKMSFSFGLKSFQEDSDFKDILAQADKNMYADKTAFKETFEAN